MKTPLIAMVSLIALVSACVDQVAPPPTIVSSVPDPIRDARPRHMSSEEARLVEEIASLHPESRTRVRALLTDSRIAAVDLEHPQAKVLLDSLYALRAGRASAQVATTTAIVVPAQVVLVDQLRDPRADVMVIRRANPALDMIVIRTDRASGSAVGAGIAGLYRLRKQFGDSPTRDLSLTIRNPKMPKKWDAAIRRDADDVIARVRNEPLRHVPGVGSARSIEIPLFATAK